MKVLTYMPLHYGKEYLRESLLSVLDVSDKIVILYSPTPSYGHGTDATCPDTEDELLRIAIGVCGLDKLIWDKQSYGSEGDHRGKVLEYATGYDLVLAVDADEVFNTEELKAALQVAYEGEKRYYGIGGYINFWRSFDHICVDGFTPIRITNLKNNSGEGVIKCTVYHFSCAQSKEIMRYKLLIHGHKDEIRPNWLEEVYLAWTPENNFPNLHLVAEYLWNATFFDKNTLPEILKNHPNFNKRLI